MSEVENGLHFHEENVMSDTLSSRIKGIIAERRRNKPTDVIHALSLNGDEEIEEERFIRAVIGLLVGLESSYFYMSEGGFRHKDGISLKGTSKGCSENVMHYFLRYGDLITELIKFCDGDHQSYGAFLLGYTYSLREILNTPIIGKLIYLAFDYMQTLRKLDILDFHYFLHSERSDFVIRKIDTLSSIHHDIVNHESFERSHTATVHVCNVLYENLVCADEDVVDIIWTLFVNVCKSVFFYLENLLVSGISYDTHNEFFYDVDLCLDPENFWDNCLKQREDLVAPVFLQDGWKYLVGGIKSRLLLKKTTEKEILKFRLQKSLHEIFMKRLSESVEETGEIPLQLPHHQDATNVWERKLSLELSNDVDFHHKYKFLTINNNSVYDVNDVQDINIPDFCPEFKLLLDKLKEPFTICFGKALRLSLQDFVEPISKTAVDHFRNQYIFHLNVLNDNFLLLKPDHQLSLYLSSVFADITTGTPIYKSSWTDVVFNDCDVRAFLSRDLRENEFTQLQILGNLHLLYREIDWLSSTLLNMDVLAIYDGAFQFLIQLRYCKWLLENMHHSLSRKTKQTKFCQQLLILRFRFCYIINTFHNFVMHEIQHASSIVMNESKKVNNYDDLRQALYTFLSAIQKRTYSARFGGSISVKKLLRKLASQAVRIWQFTDKSENESFDIKHLNQLLTHAEKILQIFQ